MLDMQTDDDALFTRDGEAGPYCPVRYVWLEKLTRGRRRWSPLVVPDIPEISETVFGSLVWLGVIPPSFFAARENVPRSPEPSNEKR
jgi:hypothetical protein